MRRKIKGPLTKKINEKAAQIARESPEISLDVKRQQFKNYIDEFYRDFSGTSELLVERLREINFFDTSYKDIWTSFLIGAGTSMLVTFVSDFADISSSNDKIVSVLLWLVAIILVVTVGTFFLWKVLLHTIFIKKAKEMQTSFEEFSEEEFYSLYLLFLNVFKNQFNDPHMYITMAKDWLMYQGFKLTPSENVWVILNDIVLGKEGE